jgi:TRAP-type transport system small permease protein
VTLVLCLIILLPTWHFMSIGAMQTSPALSWRMDFIYVSMVVMVLSLLAFSAMRIIEMLTGRSEGLPEHRAEDAP